MNNFNDFLIRDNISVEEAMRVIDHHGFRVLLVTDNDKRLLGSLSDGDIRRFILRGGSIKTTVKEAMNPNVRYFTNESMSIKEARAFLNKNQLWIYPMVDSSTMQIMDVLIDGSYHQEATYSLNCPVVIMAGGKGTRLAPYTDILPKALIPVVDKTITEHIMNRFSIFSCKNFYLILNHKKNLIKSYFEDLDCDYKISYIDEKKFLGTGGGLALLKGKINETFFLSNCDILLEANYADILDFHRNGKYQLTMVCAKIEATIPYGTVNIDEQGNLLSMQEKPKSEYLANTGFYIIEPSVLDSVEDDKFQPITDIFSELINKGGRIGVFVVDKDKWLDMGQFEELEEMERTLRSNYYSHNKV